MDILSELSQIKADYQAANLLLEEANGKTIEFQSLVSAKDAELSEKTALVGSLTEQVASLSAQLSASASELSEIKALVAKLKEEQKSATELAVEKLAEIGVKPLAVSPQILESGVIDTKEKAVEAYNNAPNAQAKAEVWKQHRKLILGK